MGVLVAIRTLCERNLLFEIPFRRVALFTLDLRVLALQRILCLRVVELLVNALHRDLLPSGRRVARGTGLGEAAVVGIFVAIGAEAKGDACVSWLAIRTVRVALLAFHLGVEAGQRITGLAVIELGRIDLFPVHEVVAGLAIGTQAALVEIFMAGNASGRQAKEGTVQVLFLDRLPVFGRDTRGIVTLVAFESRMLAFENIAGFFVVKGLCIPLDQGEIYAVVVGVTTGAFLAGARGNVIAGVKPLVGVNAGGDLGMAFQAFKGGLPPKFVTGDAIGRSA